MTTPRFTIDDNATDRVSGLSAAEIDERIAAADSGVTVEANTAGVGSPNILTSSESGKILTNEGATAKNYHTLPTAAAGMRFTFICQDSDGIRATANTGDTVRLASSVSGSAGYAESTTIGSSLTLASINATEWIAESITGTWSVV